jgi:hypothetical protein
MEQCTSLAKPECRIWDNKTFCYVCRWKIPHRVENFGGLQAGGIRGTDCVISP